MNAADPATLRSTIERTHEMIVRLKEVQDYWAERALDECRRTAPNRTQETLNQVCALESVSNKLRAMVATYITDEEGYRDPEKFRRFRKQCQVTESALAAYPQRDDATIAMKSLCEAVRRQINLTYDAWGARRDLRANDVQISRTTDAPPVPSGTDR